MKYLIPMNEYGLFADKSEKALITSLKVVELFGKRHDNVLRDIEQLDCSDNFRLLNFEVSSYKSEQNKKLPCYNMTRDGFIFLVMGYTGRKAAIIKEAYIHRFNDMEQFISTYRHTRQEFPLLTENIKLLHDCPKPYHYSNECDMINRIVLGVTAKQFRQERDIPSGESIRPYLTTGQIELLDILQKVDIGLLVSVPELAQRKEHLIKYANRMRQKIAIA